MKILILTRYDRAGPSSRYRFYQFLPYLEKENFDISISPLFNEKYVHILYSDKRSTKFLNTLSAYIGRTYKLLFDRKYDLVWIEKEALPWVPTFIEKLLCKTSVPYVIDYDDAIFHSYDQHQNYIIRYIYSKKISEFMSRATTIIAGNQYIASYAERNGAKNIAILPTVVDTNFFVANRLPKNDSFTIGWIGSPSTSRHVNVAASALNQLCNNNDVQFSAIGAVEKDVADIPGQLIPWKKESEVQELNRFDVGIMPLPDTPWEKGKCGFKLIQYMACELPVVASPVGVNRKIVKHGVDGFLAGNTEEWIKYLKILREDPELCRKMGVAGREKIEKEYSFDFVAPELISILKEATEA